MAMGGCGGLGELASLSALSGDLWVKHLRHGRDGLLDLNGRRAILKEKRHLHSLSLEWTAREDDVSVVDDDEEVELLEAMGPHSNLKELSVLHYRGATFANWLSSLVNIVDLTLWCCKRCQRLPPLDHFPFLEHVQLYDLPDLEYISTFASTSAASPTPFFPSLKELILIGCDNLKGWLMTQSSSTSTTSASTKEAELPSFPCLSTLAIKDCPNLTSMPMYPNLDEKLSLRSTSQKVLPFSVLASTSFSSPLSELKSLEIEDMECVPEGIGNIVSLQCLFITECPSLASLPDEAMSGLASLQVLKIGNCPELASLPEGIGNLRSLQELWIHNCSNLASLPQGVRRLASLQKLQIKFFPILEQRCDKETGEDWPNIAHIPNISIR